MKPTDKVSRFFSYGELFASDGAKRLGIDNTPTPEHLENLIYFAKEIGDPCREFVGGPLHISFYRSHALNLATPGAAIPSYHELGMAGDIDCDIYGHGNNKALFNFIRQQLQFAQIIWEYGTTEKPDWVHVTAFKPSIIRADLTWNQRKATRFYWENNIRKSTTFDLY